MASKDSNTAAAGSKGGGSSIVTELNVSMMIVVALIAVAAVMLGCIHLTARCYADRRRRRNGGGDIESVATMSSMRSLFHHMQQQHHHHLLHYYHHNGGGGIEQALIDALPVFPYVCLQGSGYGCSYGGKEVVEDCDCAVCLCEFLPDDRLRLLPQCLHAFHADCIGTWLLSHSTCPLCRRDLLTEPWHVAAAHAVFGISGHLYSDSAEDSTDPNNASPDNTNITSSIITFTPGLPMVDSTSSHHMMSPQSAHINPPFPPSCSDQIVLPVHLGRFRISGSSTSCAEISCASKSHRLASISSQRSYSLGSLEYVLTPKDLQVVIRPPTPSECLPITKTNDDAAERRISRGCVPVPVRTSNNELLLLDHMKERLLGKDGNKFSPTHPQMPPPSRSRAFSFRLPKPDRRWKVDQSKRRSLSETAGLECVLHATNTLDSAAATATTSADLSNAENLNNGRVTSSFRKWALVWIRS